MPVIHLTTIIKAPKKHVFDLSRSIDLHQQSMELTNEKAVAGRTTGLIEEGETVTWQAKHFFKTRSLTVKITSMQSYDHFTDEMVEGDFKSMHHEHHFSFEQGCTTMKDSFTFEAPFGILGKVVCKFFLTGYMKRLLQERNKFIKKYAETVKTGKH
ncbi:SRPBCC family protein [Panacibacter ginsenosidivorans]|uniref:SRPBCC family protein n=1 Tax=Panacibacter ginsenosidivorans TaxID=1813871 RepID=A0A5B8V9D2_9BACT|nr:SRPBCC family protein [Panacibacter ginsenosidivorans]QEC67533.1 SRPBCC family protein [Panacibacter ginsenosidivorans]